MNRSDKGLGLPTMKYLEVFIPIFIFLLIFINVSASVDSQERQKIMNFLRFVGFSEEIESTVEISADKSGVISISYHVVFHTTQTYHF